jgi:predicted DNA-binding protein
MTDKALRLAEELEKRVAVVSDKYNDERFCVLGQDEAIEAFHETVTDHWLEIERLATDAASLIRTQQEQITELAPRAAMLSAVHGALMDAGFAMGDIGQSEVEMVRTLAESNATWERKSDEAHAQIRAQQEEIERLRTICTGTARAVLATPSRVLFCDNCEWDEGDGELFQCPSCIARQYDADEGAALTEEK